MARTDTTETEVESLLPAQTKKNPLNRYTGWMMILLATASFILILQYDRNQTLQEQIRVLSSNTTQGGTVAGAATTVPDTDPTGKVPPLTANDHVMGDRNAKVLLVEYSDMECPYCKQFNDTVSKLAKAGKVAWVYRHFPLSFHANAQIKAESAECVAAQKGDAAFFTYLTEVMSTSDSGSGFSKDQLYSVATKVGVDQAEFKNCIESGKMSNRVKLDSDQGSALGIDGTPGSFLVKSDGTQKFINGALPYQTVLSMVDTMLK